MKIVALNLNHKASLRAIKPRLVEMIEKLNPDVLTLNEYVHGESRAELVQALSHIGLGHLHYSERLNGNNQVLIASQMSMLAGELRGPETVDQGGESNFLHVIEPETGLEIVGVRAPAYEATSELRAYWQKLGAIIRATDQRKIVFVGDLNANPDSGRGAGAVQLSSLRVEGWSIPVASGDWSYVSGSRIDHIVASPAVVIEDATYVAEIAGITIASQAKAVAISDHAALVVHLCP